MKKVIYIVGIIALLFVVLLYLFSSIEVSHISFSSYVEAQPSIKAGWLPAWLPKSAYDISESHDIDSNISWTKFRFSAKEKFWEPFCSAIDQKRLNVPEDRYVKRFPLFVRKIHKELVANNSLQFYYCSEAQWERYLAISEKENLAYSWTMPMDGKGTISDP